MDQASAWLPYASSAIALLSLVISTATFRRQAVRIRCRATAVPDFRVDFSKEKPEGQEVPGFWRIAVVISAYNKSPTAVEVRGFQIYRPGVGFQDLTLREKGPDGRTLDGHTSGLWHYGVESIPFKGSELTDANELFDTVSGASLIIKLGNGKTKSVFIKGRPDIGRYDVPG